MNKYRCYPALSYTSGVYAVQFPDYVKIGTAYNLRGRVREHAKAGAFRGAAFPSPDGKREQIETEALHRAAEIGTRVGVRVGGLGSERFADLSLDTAIALMHDTVRRAIGGPVLQINAFSPAVLDKLPAIYEIVRGRDAYAALNDEYARRRLMPL